MSVETQPRETKSFEAEVSKILDLMINSLYSQKEIFLRELISNASDALDKYRFESLSNSELKSGDLKIRLIPDAEGKTLLIEDNGIGMNREEVEQNIGTIARSGTGQFIEKLQEAKDRPELIGQFGVGFYSAFMVANKVVMHTQKAGDNQGVVWTSEGAGTYTIESVPRPNGHGTSITIYFKDDLEDNFTDEWKIRSVVKQYSDFISFPIELQTPFVEPEVKEGEEAPETPENVKELLDGKKVQIDVINSQKALWLRSPKEIKPEEYSEFYKHISHDWVDPQTQVHFKAEGTQEFSALMFVPSKQPMDLYFRDMKWGLQLFVKRVFIMDNCEELIPSFFRFVKGVVDSSDLSLNVSREILQQDHQVTAIRKGVTNKLLSRFKDWMKNDREDYEKMWNNFGAIIKEGCQDMGFKDKVADLMLFKSTKEEKFASFAEYVERMQDGQENIFFLSGDNFDEVKKSPLLERFLAKGYEVLIMTDPVDEWVVSSLATYKEKKFVSILDESVDIDTEEEKKQIEEEKKAAEQTLESVLKTFKEKLSDNLKDVKISTRLASTPVCLVSSQQDPSARMERIMSAMGQEMPKSKRILEINPKHDVIKKMADLDESQQHVWAKVLYSQALLQEGSPLESPVEFSQNLTEMMKGM